MDSNLDAQLYLRDVNLVQDSNVGTPFIDLSSVQMTKKTADVTYTSVTTDSNESLELREPSAEVLKLATNKTVDAKDKRAEKYGDKIENAVKFYQPSLKDKKWLTAFSWATDAGRRMVS